MEKCRRRALYLFADRKRLVPATDRSGREMILSCGAVLDHLRAAIAAAGWDTAVARYPDPTQPDHVAAVVRLDVVPDDARPQLADASRLTESYGVRLHLSIRITLANIAFRA